MFFRKNRLNTILNVLSLTLGLVSFISISLYLLKEINHNSFFQNNERIGRISLNLHSLSGGIDTDVAWSNSQVVDDLKFDYPEVEEITSLSKMPGKVKLLLHEKIFYEENFWIGDNSFFSVFKYEWLAGHPGKAFELSNSIVLTQSLNKKYFGTEFGLDRLITLNGEDYKVTGIVKDPPSNTDLNFQAIISRTQREDWCYAYVLFRSRDDLESFQKKLDVYMAETIAPILAESQIEGRYSLEKLSQLHFSPPKLFDFVKGSKFNVLAFSIIALMTLGISVFNFVNISISQSLKRQPEIAVRKILGARYNQILLQYSLESIFVVFVCFVVAILLVLCFSAINDTSLTIGYLPRVVKILYIPIGSILTIILIGFAGACYSSIYSNQQRVIEIIKIQSRSRFQKLFRELNGTLQLIAVASLIFATIIVHSQLDFLTDADAGINKDETIVIDNSFQDKNASQLVDIKNSLLDLPYVKTVSLIGRNSFPTCEMFSDVFQVENKNGSEFRLFTYVKIDESYFDVLHVNFKSGRNFYSTDLDRDVVIINQELVNEMGWEEPIGKIISGNEVIGVVEDFRFNGFFKPNEPIQFKFNDETVDKILVELPNPTALTLINLKNFWSAKTNAKLEFTFLDDFFARQLQKERDTKNLLIVFSFVSAIIAILGLICATNIAIEKRLKEIGIRKVFGASNRHLLSQSVFRFGILLLVACLISYPMTIAGINYWLQNFSLKINVTVVMFFPVVLIVGGILGILVAYHFYLVSYTNPTKILKNE